ncbi:hypothetical protein KSX_66410 [Ktedonospora formicarum]|uniref:Uncharacterized protein n=1 Tax=Ktedonospora formicarum TaxID=2778364 RepID=A0A8J3MWA9_9CHLR|nr:hypothetical protein KSX_66410 [Ktedonospora formicarum]
MGSCLSMLMIFGRGNASNSCETIDNVVLRRSTEIANCCGGVHHVLRPGGKPMASLPSISQMSDSSRSGIGYMRRCPVMEAFQHSPGGSALNVWVRS